MLGIGEPAPTFETEFWRIARAVGCPGGGAEKVCAKVEADARALWAVRVLDRKQDQLIAEHGANSPRAEWPQVIAASSGRFTVVWWGSQFSIPYLDTRDAARIVAAEALVAADPTLVEGL